MVESSSISVRENFAQQTRHHLERLRAGSVRIHLPECCELHTRQKNATFHAAPELFIQTGGATDFVCPGKSFRLKAGEMCVIPRGLPHAETPIDLKTAYRVLVFGKSFVLEGYANENRGILSHPFVFFEENLESFDLMRYLDDVSEYSTLPKSDQDAFIESLLEAFLLWRLHQLRRKSDMVKDLQSPLVVEARKYIRIHLNDSP